MSGRFIHAAWIFHPKSKKNEEAMNAVTYGETARELALALQGREAKKGYKIPEARKRIAGRVGCAPGTIETLVRGRLKRVEGWLHDRIRAALRSEIEREIKAQMNELEALCRLGAEADPLAKSKVEQCIQEAQDVLENEMGMPPLAQSARR